MAIFYLWSSRLQEWLLCHASRSFTLVRWSQCHPASRQIFHGSRHSPFARQTSLRAIASSGITYWRRGKTAVENSQKSSDNMWEKQTHTHQGQSGRRERRCSRHWTRFPRSPGEEDGEAGCSPLTHESGADIHPSDGPLSGAVITWRRLWLCGDPTLEQAPGRTCGPVQWGAHAGAVLLARFVNTGEPTQAVPEGWRGVNPCWIRLWRTAAPGEDQHGKSLLRTVSHGRDHALHQEKNVRGPSSEKEGASMITCDELTIDAIPQTPAALWREERENLRVKFCSGRRDKRRGEDVLRFGFISYYSILMWLVINWNNFPELSLFCMWQWG